MALHFCENSILLDRILRGFIDVNRCTEPSPEPRKTSSHSLVDDHVKDQEEPYKFGGLGATPPTLALASTCCRLEQHSERFTDTLGKRSHITDQSSLLGPTWTHRCYQNPNVFPWIPLCAGTGPKKLMSRSLQYRKKNSLIFHWPIRR